MYKICMHKEILTYQIGRFSQKVGRYRIYGHSMSLSDSSLSWKIVMGPQFKVSSRRLEKPGIESATPVYKESGLVTALW